MLTYVLICFLSDVGGVSDPVSLLLLQRKKALGGWVIPTSKGDTVEKL